MIKLCHALPAAALVAATILTPAPVAAAPTCQQEISIRCHGYNVQGRPRLDIYYDSYQECYDSEIGQCEGRPFAATTASSLDRIILGKRLAG